MAVSSAGIFLLLVAGDVDDGLGECLRGFLRQVVPDASDPAPASPPAETLALPLVCAAPGGQCPTLPAGLAGCHANRARAERVAPAHRIAAPGRPSGEWLTVPVTVPRVPARAGGPSPPWR